jgi:DNA-binding response OmpR family regulator
MRVLLVDDEADLASALAERLDMRGIAADWVNSGQEALERAADAHYDLAVLDLKMPKIGGLELKARMQALYPHMRFIFLTGYGSEKDFQTVACESGEQCYLVKPVEIEDLIRLMRELTRNSGGNQ